MVRVSLPQDCGNSPRNLLLRDLNVAVAKGDLAFVEKSLAPDAVWHLFEPMGQKTIRGRQAILEEFRNNLVIEPAQYAIDTVISHGKRGAVNGAITAADGKRYVYCDVYLLSGLSKTARVVDMTSLIIEDKRP
jgi:ketosteroid isomerase-like protein